MTAEQVTTAVSAHLTQRVERAMSDYMSEVQANMRQLISVPVQYVAGHLGRPRRPKPIGPLHGPGILDKPRGRRVIRSLEGQPPRKEFGNYYESMKAVVRVNGERVTGILGTDIKDGRAWKLEKTFNRPHFSTMYDRIRSEGIGKLKQYMR